MRWNSNKVLGSWSGMRKYLEQEMLCEELKGRVRYHCTKYPGMDGCGLFEVYLDDKLIKRFSWETVNNYFIENGYKDTKEYFGKSEYWTDFMYLFEKITITERTEYADDEFADALDFYRNNEISASLNSENPLHRMFAILDRRVGKRTLEKQKELIDSQPDWLKSFYRIRIEASL